MLACSDEDTFEGECSAAAQNAWVKRTLQDWYIENTQIPDLDPTAAPDPRTYLGKVIESVDLVPATPPQEVDLFSMIRTVDEENRALRNEVNGYGLLVRAEQDGVERFLRIVDVLGRLDTELPTPASRAGLQRGDAIVSLDGVPIAEALALERLAGLTIIFGAESVGVRVRLGIRKLGMLEVTSVSMTSVRLNPRTVPLFKVIARGESRIGYLYFRGFDFASIEQLRRAFKQFSDEGVTEVIVDVRYNLGGIAIVVDYLANLLLGNELAKRQAVVRREVYNEEKSSRNAEVIFAEPTCPTIFAERDELAAFDCEGAVTGLTGLRKIGFITSRTTASAAEAIINSMRPHVDVVVVGERTFGKPVGSLPFPFADDGSESFCGLVLRPSTVRNVNANGEGGYFDGIPPDCPFADDPTVEIGSEVEGALAVALAYLGGGECPVGSSNGLRATPARRRLLLDTETTFGYGNSLARLVAEGRL